MQRRSFLSAAAATTVSAAVLLTGCSSTSAKKTAASTAGESPTQRLTTAKKVVDSTAGFHLDVTSKDVPSTAGGLLTASGDGSNKPVFKGDLTVQIAGASAKVPVVAIDGKVYAQLPIAPSFTAIDPSTYGAPDPNVLLSSGAGGLSSLLPMTQNAKSGPPQRNGSETVQVINGTLPSSAVRKTLGFGKESTGLSYVVQYQIGSGNELRQVQLSGPFFAAGDKTTYVLKLTRYGEKVNVTKP
ncbi:LppX_LprAFG lipoprotein [Dermatophilaceae bacterium Sec6.4]